MVNNVLLLPTLARRITQQVKDDDDDDAFIKVKGQQRSNVVNYVLWLPYCATVFRSVYRSSSFFFCQHFSDLYLGHHLTDFDQTWSQVLVDHPIYVT